MSDICIPEHGPKYLIIIVYSPKSLITAMIKLTIRIMLGFSVA